jgi:hypothetical protein
MAIPIPPFYSFKKFTMFGFPLEKFKHRFHFTMNSITITLHDGEAPPQCVTVNVMDSIQTIHNHIPTGVRRLILFQGSLLLTGFSFKYHGIKEGDDLYVIRPNPSLKRHQNVGNHRSLSTKRFGRVHNVDALLREASRLSDLTDRRLMIQTPPFGLPDEETSVQVDSDWKTILDGTADSDGPNTEPLPPCWE